METTKKIGMRILCGLICLLCLLGLVLPASAAVPKQDSLRALAAAVYRSPSADAIVVGMMQDGASLRVLGSVGEYYEINCDGMTGYINKAHIHYSLEKGYTVNCVPKHPDVSVLSLMPRSEAGILRTAVLDLGYDLLGVPYVYGGKSPWGFDCSGFVSYVYENHGISLHRCADEQMQDGLIVERSNLQKGDLVFFSVYGPWLASHVGIYIGNGQMIHASSSRGICVDTLDNPYWANTYVGARRLIAVDTSLQSPFVPVDAEGNIIAEPGVP